MTVSAFLGKLILLMKVYVCEHALFFNVFYFILFFMWTGLKVNRHIFFQWTGLCIYCI